MAGVLPITEPAREVDRLRRLYDALRLINRAVIEETSRDALCAGLSKVLAGEGGFATVRIGWFDSTTGGIAPVTHEGASLGAGEGPGNGRDPPAPEVHVWEALVEGRPFVCDDVRAGLTPEPWRAAIERAGLRAVAALPIRVAGQPAGVLSAYSARANAFGEDELGLLEEASRQLSFALDGLAAVDSRRAAEEELVRSRLNAEREQRFASGLIEAMPGIFYFYDEAGRFLRWNRNFEVVSGHTSAEIERMHPVQFFRSEDRALVRDRIAQVFERGDAVVEAPFLAADGTGIPHLFTGRRVTLDGATCLLGVGIDISERVRAEDERRRTEERYRSTLESMAEAGQLLDFDFRYLYLNPAAAAQNRRPNEELLGRTMPEAWPGIEATEVFGVLERSMKERVPIQTETEFTFLDGSSGWFDVRVQPVPEGIFILSLDVTSRKRAEHELRLLNEKLEAKVAERTRELEVAKVRAESADRLKSAFLATMSHELRTPLNSIIGFTGIILQGLAGPLNAEQEKQLGMVKGSARHLLALINDVLDISKIEAGQLEIRAAPFDPREALERVAATIRPLAEKKGLALTVDVVAGVTMKSDRRRFEQIVLNLLNNAIKFTEAGSVGLSAEVRPAASEGSGERMLRVRVSDTGLGIRDDDRSKLFQPFRQLDTGLQRQHEGTGLGLAICRRLTDLLGGTIDVESVWQRGSVFSVSLPMDRMES